MITPRAALAMLAAVTISSATTGTAADLRFRMQPLWTLDPDATTPLVGFVEDAVLDAAGTAYLLDAQLADIKVVDGGGAITRTLGRAGDGPGEFRVPGEIFFFPDSSLGVVSKMGGLLKRVDPDTGWEIGAYRLDARATDGMALNQILTKGSPLGTLLVASMREWTGMRYGIRLSLSVLNLAPENDLVYPYAKLLQVGEYQDVAHEEENYYLLWRPWTLDTMGRIVAAPYWDRYELRWLDDEGTVVQSATLPFDDRRRSDRERGRLLALWGGTDPEPINGLRLRVADHEAVVREIYPRPDGGIWVRTNRSGFELPAGEFMRLDAIDSHGRRVGTVTLIGPGDEGSDCVFWGPDDRLLIVHGGEEAKPWSQPPGTSGLPPFTVACYRLVREKE